MNSSTSSENLTQQRLPFSLWMMSYVRIRQWNWRPEFDSWQGQRILLPPSRLNSSDIHLLPIKWRRVGRTRPMCEAYHSFRSNTEIKNTWRFTSSASLDIHDVMFGNRTIILPSIKKIFWLIASGFFYQFSSISGDFATLAINNPRNK
jgi:hypothetical protein